MSHVYGILCLYVASYIPIIIIPVHIATAYNYIAAS